MELMLPSQALNRQFVGVESGFIKNEPDLKSNNELSSYHAFRIGDIGILIPQNVISEVAEELPYCRLPNTTSILYGMANLRGNIIPIFDLHVLLGFSSDSHKNRKVLILGRGADAIAVMTSELPVRITITPEHSLKSMPPIPSLIRQYTKNSYQNEGIWLDVDNDFYVSLSEYLQ
jgi:twitching motility protein PilI